MKLYEVININGVIKDIIDDKEVKNGILKFKLLTIMKSIEQYINNYEIIKNEKIVQYGKFDEESNTYSINPQNVDADIFEKYSNELTEILNTDIDTDIEKIDINDLIEIGIKSDSLLKMYSIIKQ